MSPNTGSTRPRDADDADLPAICVLLEQGGLPTSDIPVSKPRFKVLCEGSKIVAVGGIEHFGTAALLRSVVVAAARRGMGLGRIIVEELENSARAAQVGQLVLLTETAREFFASRGYQVVERDKVPEEVRYSAEFRALCPATATCMMKAFS